jgi:steroid delta-isomerase-like uncharacterized protein
MYFSTNVMALTYDFQASNMPLEFLQAHTSKYPVGAVPIRPVELLLNRERSITMRGYVGLVAVCVATAGFLGSGCSSSSTMRLERNKALVREVFTAPRSDYRATIRKCVAPEYLWHQPGSVKPLNRDEVEKFIGDFNNAFPDCRLTIEDMVAEGDKVVTRYTVHGTHKGAFMGTPATGKEVSFGVICISRIQEGKIVEEWEEADTLGWASQVGVISIKR